MLSSLYHEMKELSKKSPDGRINEVKVKMINRVLEKMKFALSAEPTIEYLDLLDNEGLPSNSDVVLILSQYMAGAEQFRGAYFKRDTAKGEYRWYTKEHHKSDY